MKGINEEFDIYSEEVKDVLSTPPKAIFRWGNIIILLFISLIIFFSWWIKYPDIITAQAILTTKIPPQKEFAKVSGKIDSLFVTNYQKVNKNSPLALIENTANYKDIIYLKSILDTLNITSKHINFPVYQIPMLLLGDIENEFSLFEKSYILYELNKNSQSFINAKLANKYSLSQLKYRLQTLNYQKELNRKELMFKKKDLIRIETLFTKGIISEQEFDNKKLDFLQAERNFNNIDTSISQIKETISNTNNLEKQIAIDDARERINLFKGVIHSLNKLKNSIKEWELKYLFKSNINGTVSFMKIWNKNQTISNGDLVFTIIPEKHSSYICKVKAPVLNSGKIKIDQDVNIKLSGYPDIEYGVLKGKVQDISLISNNEGMYLLDISLPNNFITTYNKKIKFKQEMQGSAVIITEDLRLIERFFYHFKALVKRS